MKHDEILQAAKEAGLYLDGVNQSMPIYVMKLEDLQRFAAIVEKQRDELLAVCKNFEIQGPDADNLVWLVLHGNGTTGKGMVNLGEDGMLVTQAAQCLETDRKAAIARAKGEQ